MSSGMLDQYIYENDKGDLFFVQGVWQTSNMGNLTPKLKKEDSYHMALVIPVRSRKNLVKVLQGKMPFRNAMHLSSYSYLLILKPMFYRDDRGGLLSSMHEVKDDKEVSRKKELELHEFEFIQGKKCPTNTLPWSYNPTNWNGPYEIKKKLSFIFLDEDEKQDISNFIKKYK